MDYKKYKQKVGFVRFYLIILGLLCLLFYAGYRFANLENQHLRAQVESFSNSLANLTKEHQQLESDFNKIRVELEISQLANEQSQADLKQAFVRESQLKEQISFYQRVMAPESSQDGFVIEGMEINPTASENNYSVKMILLQKKNIKAVIKGELKITVFGSTDGKASNYNFVVLQDEPKSSLAFSFKYFQLLETTITLPEGFIAERFDIRTDIYRYRKKRGTYKTTISWQDAIAEEATILD